MSVNKQQFELPRKVRCHSPDLPMPDGEPRLLSARSAQNGRPIRIQHQSNAGSECEAHLTAPTFVALPDLKNLRAVGIAYPSTVHGWRWLFRNRHERGWTMRFGASEGGSWWILNGIANSSAPDLRSSRVSLSENLIIHSAHDAFGVLCSEMHVPAYDARFPATDRL